ncbi:AAA-like domain-containing protein [Scytonema sp. PCC 10023]|uniref:AAA-like domain-containing protein n=1 Tax=Scytonema sp. PCC 10023 TaxID=1680591 RepID=UPI0039C5E4ED
MVDQYIFSGSLPEEATTYVTREADGELYEGLKAGKFCYVLNSRQSGKSSLRVRTMRRLRESGVECAAIDLSAGGIQNVPPEQWYADLIDTLVESFGLDVEFGDWWSQNQLNSLVTRFRKFLEEILLAEIKENIVIFIDEIDSVLSLNFPTDDFFAFIRACYNQRVDNPEYNRLTFCLLGVASPSNLIEDKKRTPFNIGKAISLKGFQLHEVEPLEKGLHGRYSDSQAVMKEILHWTGGQPFLTQKLCQFIVEESERDNPRTVEQVVRSRIIENWESQDEPEHLRTIRDRILRDEQRASYLLELYQQIRQTEEQSEITADDTLEQSELQLSGLVVSQQNKLRVYNPIYKEIFEQNWIETQLRNLRPYSENFKFWVASGGSDDSRLLRGKALQDALSWAKDKSLNYQDREFLAASQAKEKEEASAAKEQEAALKREREDKEAAQARNQLLSEANKKVKIRISCAFVVLVVAVLGATTIGLSSRKQLNETKEEVEAVQELNKLAGELQKNTNSRSLGITFDSNEALRLSALSFNINNHQLKQALVFAASSQAYQQLKKLKEAEREIKQSQKILYEAGKKNLDSSQGLQVQVLFQQYQGSLLAQYQEIQKATEAYNKAFKILKNNSQETDFTKGNQLLTGENIEAVHRRLIELLSKNHTKSELRKDVEASLTKHLYAQLKYYLKDKNWKAAEPLTSQLMLNVAKREEQQYLDDDDINNFSCPDLKEINKLWVESDKRFGFSVQKEIWIKTGNRLSIKPLDWTMKDYDNYLRFAKTVGWYDDKKVNEAGGSKGDFLSYDDLIERIKDNPSWGRGSLPMVFLVYWEGGRVVLLEGWGSRLYWKIGSGGRWGGGGAEQGPFFSRVATCKV